MNYPVQYRKSSQFLVFCVAACPPSFWCWWESKCCFVSGLFCCLWVVVMERCCVRIFGRCFC